ncbi:hypothetical protein Pint_09760 [Pistacia integerrima]|uniref:Uncharacterized protein n=1 Tax=Pistacia integerrima TaxID=434235 RepID=A0ACC0XFA7_9ROSI|nr:hypothetical protein Pint_09760 [Pistacia integerrima]
MGEMSLYGGDASNRAQVLRLARNSSCVEEGSMVNGVGRTPQAGRSPPFVNSHVLETIDVRIRRARSPPSRCEGLSNGMVHSIVARFERGQPLIVEDGKPLLVLRW